MSVKFEELNLGISEHLMCLHRLETKSDIRATNVSVKVRDIRETNVSVKFGEINLGISE